jgi:cell division protein FtsW
MKVGYRHKRMLVFLNPWKYEKGSGFQIIQSFIALGSGGLFGSGLTESKQKLFFLPKPYTDFIFAIIGEELGFIGAVFIIILFIILVYKGMAIALQSTDMFYKLLAVGVTSLIGIEAIFNIGVNIGMLPTKGTTLPFISYGGSSLVFKLACIGIILNVADKVNQVRPGYSKTI